MKKPYLVTAALPYANGSIHIGHLVEYVMTDVYVRALRLAGEEAYYICADDTHGTPIELNAQKAGVTPETFVARFAKEHLRDFTAFQIRFDSFYSTNSEENRRWVHEIYGKLKDKGLVTERTIKQLYDEKAERFLPDRFVKGTCPKCKAPDQYGDVCEVCNSTYTPEDLLDPYSVVSGTRPVLRDSEHLYVKLSELTDMLRDWSSTEGRLQPEIKNFIDGWIEGGLQDWCISRDPPYFGFEIPDRPGKFFYVWMDAPVGYISSSEHCSKELAEKAWRRGEAHIEHVIGKDIVYFHTLFWPAMLHAAELTVPDKVHVHGMLTVDGVKMSKTKGTFIQAATYLEHLDPSYLRYYLSSKTSRRAEDLDLSLEEFSQRVNAELVNNIVNLVTRGAPFIKSKLGGAYGALPDDAEAHLNEVRKKVDQVEAAYRALDLAAAVRATVDIANLGNKIFQDAQPWKAVHDAPNATLKVVTLCLNIARAAIVCIAPVVPDLAEKAYAILGLNGAPASFDEARAFDLKDREIGEPARLLDRMDKKALVQLIEASKPKDAAPAAEAAEKKKEPKKEPKKKAPEGPPPEIEIDDFAKVDLRVGKVLKAELVEGADKLLQLTVDLGEAEPRTIFAGIRAAYAPEQVEGRKVCVVANLKPRKMRFGLSQGMVLAAGPGGKDIWLVDVPEDAPIGSEVR